MAFSPTPAGPVPIRDLALIGAGDWGKHLARCFAALGALKTIVVPATQSDLPALKQRFANVAFTSSVADALGDPAIRKVVVATPADSHFELAATALAAGKDVLVEKPLCLKAVDAERLLALAHARSCILMVGHLLHYHPCVVRLRELVKDGALGRLLSITSSRLNLGKFRKDVNALYSFAPHDISLVLALLEDELPRAVRCFGDFHLSPDVADSTFTLLEFSKDVSVQLRVSWLNPFKEQRLTVIGSEAMAVFDDTQPWADKLLLYRNCVSWGQDQEPIASKALGERQLVVEQEPLQVECEQFLLACSERRPPLTDGHEGFRVLRVLDMAQQSLQLGGERVGAEPASSAPFFAHPTAIIDAGARIGAGSKVWHFSHVMRGARIGERCSFGQNVYVAGGAVIGSGVKVQNNVSIYDGVELEDDVFLGPSCVLTNVKHPRAELSRKHAFSRTLVRRGATVGANATIVCGVSLGRYCFIGAGAVVTRDVPDYALMVGSPAERVGWVGRHGLRLQSGADGVLVCPESGLRYRELAADRLTCLDLDQQLATDETPCSSPI